jgi:hypothetical protein
LYPATSHLPDEAVERFRARAEEVSSSQGPLRYMVDSHGFRLGDAELAQGQSQVVGLAEALHAMQVGQLLIAPGITTEEIQAFITVTNTDPATVRREGGIRSVLATLQVTHMAVIEVTLRSSDEEGILGIDLVTAPLDEIAERTAEAALNWAAGASSGTATDTMAIAVGRLEDATREIAMERVSAALMQLDEPIRMQVLGAALTANTSGSRMEGMLAVIARMKPAALSRLLRLFASSQGTQPDRLVGAMQLPPETAKLLALYLAPTPSLEPDFGVPDTVRAQQMAREMATVEDDRHLAHQVATASPQLASGRALSTAIMISRTHPDDGSIRALGDTLPAAARTGAFSVVREGLRRLDELASIPGLSDSVRVARATLSDPAVLADVCALPTTDADAAIAGEILASAGAAGAEALLDCYIQSTEPTRSLLRPVVRGMSEGILGVARSRLRTEDGVVAVAILRVLPALGDKRVVPVLSAALDNLDVNVRTSAVTALADTPSPEARAALVKAANHADPQTQRFAIREIGRVRVAEAIPALSRALEDINPFARTHDTKKEIISAMLRIGSKDALPVLRRVAGQRILFGWKKKELRFLARRAVEHLSQADNSAKE